MKIQTTNVQLNNRQQNNAKGKNSDVAFKGAENFVQFLRFLDTNQSWGAVAIDVTCMDTPRTIIDFTRSPEAGLETARRDFSSTANNVLTGAYGLGAAWLFAGGLNKQFGINAHKMFVDDDTVDILSHTWDANKNSKNPLKSYLKSIISDVKGFNPHSKNCNQAGWIGIDTKTQKQVIKKLADEITNGPEKISKESHTYLKALIADSVGAENKFIIKKDIGGKTKESITTLDDFIGNIHKMSKAFVNDNVGKTFRTGNIHDNVFVKGLKKLNKRTSIIGIGIAALIGCSQQPFNMYLTKRKTGKSGFVGVEGREPDKSNKFKLLKAGVAAGWIVGFMKTIGKSSELLNKMQFKGFSPTLPQFKLIYGATIASRLISARDKNELREAAIKDSLGYASWLILGGFVSKLTAAGFEKMDKFKNADEKFIKYNEVEHGKGWFNWLTKSEIISRDEVLRTEMKKVGTSTIKNGKAMSFKEMMKVAPKMAKTKVKYLNMIQFAGYLYSGLALGIGIPKLNIAITKSIELERKAKERRMHKRQQANELKK